MKDLRRGNTFIFWLLTILFWLMIGSIDMYVNYQRGFNQPKNFLGELISIFTGLGISIVVGSLYRAFRIFQKRIATILIVIAIISVVFGVMWHFIDYFLSIPLYGFDPIIGGMKRLSISGYLKLFLRNSMIFLSWSGMYVGTILYNDKLVQKLLKDGALMSSELAQLKMLRYQLNPHFLFNSLSSLRSLIRVDQDKADEMLTELSEFLRFSLKNQENIMVTVSQEMKMLEHYLKIEKVRFSDNLRYQIRVSSLAEEFPILSFILQPIIENAIKYGMKTSKMPLNIEILAKVTGNKLIINIKNSGSWYHENDNTKVGIGIDNIKLRLLQVYGEKHSFKIEKNNSYINAQIEITEEIGNE